MSKLVFQRGDTFSLAGPLDPVFEGAPVPSLEGWTGTAQLRNAATRELIADLVVTILDPAARLVRVSFAGSTASWPVARVRLNVRLVAPGGQVVSTEPDEFQVVRANTEAPTP